MRKSRFTEAQIMAILGEGEAGLPVAQVCLKHEISTATCYQWKSKYAGLSSREAGATA
jgi:putative transposase